MATGSEEGSMILWDFVKGKMIHTLKDIVKGPIYNLDFSVDETCLLVASKKKILYYSMNDLKEERSRDIYASISIPKSHGSIPLEPMNYFEISDYDVLFAKFNVKNTIFAIGRKYMAD